MPRQVDHDGRRAAIAEAVSAIAAERGFAEVTIRAVAARAGASTSAVTHYVSGRDELVRTAVRRALDVQRGRLEAETHGREPGEALRAVVRWSVLGAGERAHRLWLAIVVGARSEPVVRAELDAFNRWWDALLRRLVHALDPAPADPGSVVDALDVVISGLVMVAFEETEPWSRARRERAVDALLAPLGL
ncbi:TetR/AcrR family transcriptional regulator [Spirillospora sp. CA-294931]|uniref:TetR/AcrR family transcriptional regulator n=1 Tax=Spirillospora sp. CA-294931 TaxID=3240042 RepID=UPI003D91C027